MACQSTNCPSKNAFSVPLLELADNVGALNHNGSKETICAENIFDDELKVLNDTAVYATSGYELTPSG